MMSQLEFNVKAKFVYTKLLPLVKEASRSDVDSLCYEASDDAETVVIHYAGGGTVHVDATADSLVALAMDVLRKVS